GWMVLGADSVGGVRAGLAGCCGLKWVRKCILGELNQQKNGRFARAWRCMKSIAAAEVSSSIVSIRFLVNGPESSILPSADDLMTPRGPNFFRYSGSVG